jgi:hypothetical protein
MDGCVDGVVFGICRVGSSMNDLLFSNEAISTYKIHKEMSDHM